MKYYLLIDEKPESCETCPIRSYSNLQLMCTPMREGASDVECPLKPMPKKAVFYPALEESYWDGWNDCIEELLNTGLNYSKDGEELKK